MSQQTLFVFVEGVDDEIFFEKILSSHHHARFCSVHMWPYANRSQKSITSLLRSLQQIHADYVFIADMDDNPCVSSKKAKLIAKFPNLVPSKIFIVNKEIESWYLAGIDAQHANKLRLKIPSKTDAVDKAQFESMIPRKFISRIDFMLEILKVFSWLTAQQKNKSFHYFVQKSNVVA